MRNSGKAAFTLMELLAVVAVIAILASLLLAAIGRATEFAQGSKCLSNVKQLQQGWLMYAEDHGVLPPNHDGPDERNTWAPGWLSFEPGSTESTNILFLVDRRYASLASYITQAGVYRCPSDKSMVQIGARAHERVRSYSMNQAMGLSPEEARERTDPVHLTTEVRVSEGERFARSYRRLSDIREPSQRWVLMDEHPDSINDATFALGLPQSGPGQVLWDVPAPYHSEGSAIAFADGHAEVHEWQEEDTLAPIRYEQNLLEVKTDQNRDFQWLSARTTRIEEK